MRQHLVSFILLIAALLLAGCGDDSPVPRCQQKDGQRIIAMAPSTAEILYALGLSNEVVGVSRFTTYPPDVTNKTVVGGLYDPNWEIIVSLRPTLVIGLETQQEIAAQLKALDIPFVGTAHEHIDEIMQSILTIGQACGAENEAQQLFQHLRGQSYDLMFKQKTLNHRTDPLRDPLRVLVCVGHDETLSRMYVAAKGTFYDELLDLAGAQNACDVTRQKYPEISPEGLASMNPDLVIDILPPLGKIPDDFSKGWKPYPAVAFTNNYASIPGPRFVLLLEDFIQATQQQLKSE